MISVTNLIFKWLIKSYLYVHRERKISMSNFLIALRKAICYIRVLTTESRYRVYGHACYYSCKFLVGLGNSQTKRLGYKELRSYLGSVESWKDVRQKECMYRTVQLQGTKTQFELETYRLMWSNTMGVAGLQISEPRSPQALPLLFQSFLPPVSL